MNEPPIPPDPEATQPYSTTGRTTAQARVIAPPPPPAAYVHRFGSVPFYVLARFLAFAIDGLAVPVLIATFAFNALEPGGPSILSERDAGTFGILAAVAFGSAFLIGFACEALFGTTLGKAVFALQVRRANGRRIGFGSVLARALLRPLDALLIGPLLALVLPRHQRLGDLAGRAVVAHSRVGPLLSVAALALLGGLGYAEVVFGGGITSALGVASEAAAFGPGYATQAAALVGIALPRMQLPASPVHLPISLPLPTATPSPEAAAATAAPVAEDSPEPEASPDPTDDPTDPPDRANS